MKKNILMALLLTGFWGTTKIVAQGGEQYLGQIIPVAFNFAPQGWAQCNGQLLSINQNQALFALLGTQYGGNGTTTFALPDLRGRMIVGKGAGTGTLNITQGEKSGSETIQLTTVNLPPHNHTVGASSADGTTSVPTNAVPANSGALDKEYAPTANTTMIATGNSGSNVPVNNMKPYAPVFYIIALQGIFPSQN